MSEGGPVPGAPREAWSRVGSRQQETWAGSDDPGRTRAERVEARSRPDRGEDDLTGEVAAQLRIGFGEGEQQGRAVEDDAVHVVARNLSDDRRVVGEGRRVPDPLDRPAERAELGVERGRLRPREHVRREADGDGATPAECVVGVGAEAGHPLSAVRVELEEVPGRVRVGPNYVWQLPFTS